MFINRDVFPNGEINTVSNARGVMEPSQFEILDVEALQYVSEETYRRWRFYINARALE